jgi:serine phosphatase RsbU (regulator of sigma subunit)/anti-sigma regulatory factor (Ser/Thr protein kinase)
MRPDPPAKLAAAVPGAHLGHSTIAIPADLTAPGKSRGHVVRELQANAVGDDMVRVVELLVSEVVTNVIRHANASLAYVDIELDVEVTADAAYSVTVTVSGGASAPSMALVHPPGLPESSSESGRGLEMLDALAAVWGTRREQHKTVVWFTVRSLVGAAHGGTDAALDAVISAAVATATATEAELAAEPAVVAGLAAVTAEQAAAGAAVKTADAAQSARVARAVAATLAAEAVAEAAARTVEAVQRQADELALEVASAAAVAAATVSNSILPGGDAVAEHAALRVGATVFSAAAAKSEETARAAVVVARAVAEAAAAVAATTADAAAAMEHEVSDAAVAVQAVTVATAQQLASDTLERGAASALVASASAAASQRWQETNQLLLQAGRHDRTIALALQAAMLTQLPESDTLQLAARYLTAAEHDQVGGDWYDALVLPDGSTTLVIGDVIGHDIIAAAAMGQLRNLLRALVWDRNEPPSAVVTRLDRAIRDLRINAIASLIVVSVERRSAVQSAGVSTDTTLRWTNAGHPAPILIHADGTAFSLDDTTDLLLGVEPGTVRRDYSHAVPLGATLLLYTDGLIETRSEGLDTGQQRLLHTLSKHHDLELGELLDAVLTDMVGDQPGDDVAVLAVRFHDPTRGSAQAPDPRCSAGDPVPTGEA